MAKDRNQPHDRYDTSGNPEAEYVDPEKKVLLNKLGITNLVDLQVVEEKALATAYEALLQEIRIDTPMTCELLKHIHNRIFGELYQWAGQWRTVWIRKPGVTWPPPDFLEQSLASFEQEVLAVLTPAMLLTDDDFCKAIGKIQGEFLVIHPFREGNARTIKLLSDLLAAQTNRPLLAYDKSAAGRDRYIEAAKSAFKRNYRPMAELIHDALAGAKP